MIPDSVWGFALGVVGCFVVWCMWRRVIDLHKLQSSLDVEHCSLKRHVRELEERSNRRIADLEARIEDLERPREALRQRSRDWERKATAQDY